MSDIVIVEQYHLSMCELYGDKLMERSEDAPCIQ